MKRTRQTEEEDDDINKYVNALAKDIEQAVSPAPKKTEEKRPLKRPTKRKKPEAVAEAPVLEPEPAPEPQVVSAVRPRLQKNTLSFYYRNPEQEDELFNNDILYRLFFHTRHLMDRARFVYAQTLRKRNCEEPHPAPKSQLSKTTETNEDDLLRNFMPAIREAMGITVNAEGRLLDVTQDTERKIETLRHLEHYYIYDNNRFNFEMLFLFGVTYVDVIRNKVGAMCKPVRFQYIVPLLKKTFGCHEHAFTVLTAMNDQNARQLVAQTIDALAAMYMTMQK